MRKLVLLFFVFTVFTVNAQVTNEMKIEIANLPKEYSRPDMSAIPDFVVYEYSYHISKKQIGYLRKYVHPMSSSGIGAYYYEIIPNVDYDSFEIIKGNFAKDKNRLYLYGSPIHTLSENASISHGAYTNFGGSIKTIKIIEKNKVSLYFPGISKTVKYENVEIISNIVFKKKDSVFVYDANEYSNLGYVFIKKPNFDLKTLKHISGSIFQDKKNLFKLYNGDFTKIEEEQIVDSITFKEEEKDDPRSRTIFIGKKGFYFDNDKISNYKLNNYHFVENTNYYFYNNNLYYFENGFSNYPVGVSGKTIIEFNEFENGLRDSTIVERDFRKVKILGRETILYDKKELIYENKIINYDSKIDITKLKYGGRFSQNNNVKIITKNHLSSEYCVFSIGHKKYSISDKNLCEISKIKLDNVKSDLPSLKILNEHYFVDKKTFFTSYNMSKNNYPKITSKDINLTTIRAFNKYFTDGKNIYYNCKKIDPKRDSTNIKGNYARGLETIRKFKTKNNELKNINFHKLKIIKNNDFETNYLTDEKYLIFEENIIGTIDYNSLKILENNYIEDKDGYFFTDYYILKKDLKGN